MIKLDQHGPVTAIRMARSFLGRPIYWTAAYLVDGLLIDSGPACTAMQLIRVLGQSQVDQIVVTHSHEDHIGGLAALRMAFPQARIYANWRTLPQIEDPSRLKLQPYRRLLWGTPQPFYSTQLLTGNQISTPNYTFRLIETPGHSLDHVSIFEPKKGWLFSGDAFIGGKDGAWSPEFDMFSIIGSLRGLIALRPRRLFPGSGHVRLDPMPTLQGKLLYLTKLCEHVAELDTKRQSTEQIVQQLFGGESMMNFWTRGHFSARNLVNACRSYNALIGPLSAGRLRGRWSQASGLGQGEGVRPSPPFGRSFMSRSEPDLDDPPDPNDWTPTS